MIDRQSPHPLAGKTVTLKSGLFKGHEFWVEDWQSRVFGKSWMDCDGNPACIDYALRSHAEGDPSFSNDVVYGKIEGLGKIIHIRHLPEQELAEFPEEMAA